MNTVCPEAACTGCMACLAACPVSAISVQERISCYCAQIDASRCIACGLCMKVCQVQNPLKLKRPVMCWQGWAKDDRLRARASSGGLATALAAAFLRNGGVVYTCVFRDGEFAFVRMERASDLETAAGSKYVKSTMRGAYAPVKKSLLENEKVLVIGLPCQIAGVKNFVGEKLQERLYTIDLICHGTPAPELLELYLRQRGKSLKTVQEISFRNKDCFGLAFAPAQKGTPRGRDAYMIAFLNGLSYTENCYRCAYARYERVGDITLGDSWGSDLPGEEQRKGISLVLVQSEKGRELLAMADIEFCDVDIDKAVSANKQLRHPSKRPAQRDEFMAAIRNGKRFDWALWKCYPRQCAKQLVKKALIVFCRR